MMSSLFAGVSGLKNHQTKMNVVGDNIANVNTIGFKMGRVTFQEALVQTLSGASSPTSSSGGTNPQQLGLGMSISSVDNLFIQGGLETTGETTDLAIQGTGFFVLSNGTQEFYTRAGSFSYDADSNLVNPSNGFIVQGKMAEVDGTISANTSVGNITLPFGQQDPAQATTEITLGMNLDATATDATASLISAGTSNVTSISGTADDGSGGTHTITISGENAQNSELSGLHALELDDVEYADLSVNQSYDPSGTLVPSTTYYYTVVTYNELGESYGEEFSVALTGTNNTVSIDWTNYTDITDATEVHIYRSTVSGDYTSGNNGRVKTITDLSSSIYVDYGDTPESNVNPPTLNETTDLTGSESLSQLGITDTSGLEICVDNDTWIPLTSLTTASTVNDLVDAINTNTTGVTASIEDGQVYIKRDYAGSSSVYNVEIRDGGTGNVCAQVFGTSDFMVDNGAASTLRATDIFTPNITGTDLEAVELTLITDETTGLVTGIEDIGDGGITLNTGTAGLVGDPDGTGLLDSSTLIIETEDTQHATSITAYDSQGGEHTITMTFTKSYEDNTWFWNIETGGDEIISSGGSGTVQFNSDGSLASFTMDGGVTSLTIDPNNGADSMVINLDTGTSGAFDGLTGFSSDSTASARSQDGYGLGVLSDISIDETGTITGVFTNGVTRVLAQIYLAEFNNSSGLSKVGQNLYQATANSGNAILSTAGSSSASTVTSGALEISNVDLAQEFTSMIVAQRGFQANARVITTSDDMLNELVNLKG